MARSRGIKEYMPPMRGLNTSLSPRAESEEFFTDGLNMRARFNPARLEPRRGVKNNVLIGVPYQAASPQTGVDISFGEWRNPNNDKEKSFIWIKNGTQLFFYDITTESVLTTTVNLEDALSGTSLGTAAKLAATRIEGSTLKGNLVLVGEAIEPVLVQWDGTVIEAYVLNLIVRDILGLEDGLDVDERPATLAEDHEYNLYNQGWYKQRRVATGGVLSDPIAKFFGDTAKYPSNADISHLGIVDNGAGELLFDSSFLEDLTFGNTPSPRGHYPLDAFDMNRETRKASPEVSGLTSGGSSGSGTESFGRVVPSGGTGTHDPVDDESTIEP